MAASSSDRGRCCQSQAGRQRERGEAQQLRSPAPRALCAHVLEALTFTFTFAQQVALALSFALAVQIEVQVEDQIEERQVHVATRAQDVAPEAAAVVTRSDSPTRAEEATALAFEIAPQERSTASRSLPVHEFECQFERLVSREREAAIDETRGEALIVVLLVFYSYCFAQSQDAHSSQRRVNH